MIQVRTSLLSVVAALAALFVSVDAAARHDGEHKALAEKIQSRIDLSAAEREWISQGRIIRFRVAENSPEQFLENGQAQGLSVDYARIICSAFALECQFVPFLGGTFSEALSSVGLPGGPDVFLTGRPNPARAETMRFTRPYLFTPSVIVTRSDATPVFSLADLRDKTVVIEKGYVIRDRLTADIPNVRLIDKENTSDALQTLASGVGDAYVGNLTTATFLASKLGLGNLKVAAPTGYPIQGESMMIRRDWPELASIMDKALGAFTPQEGQTIQSYWYSLSYDRKSDRVFGTIALVAFILLFVVVVVYARFVAAVRKAADGGIERANSASEKNHTSASLIDMQAFLAPSAGNQQKLDSVQVLLDQLRPVSVFSNRFSETIFIFSCIGVGTVGLVGYGYLLVEYFFVEKFNPSLMMPLPFAAFLLAMGLGVKRLGFVPSWAVTVVVVVFLFGVGVGSYLNGPLTSTFLVLFVVFFHLIQSPNRAFVASCLLLLEILVATVLVYPADQVIFGIRAFLNGLVAMVLMRLMMITFNKLSMSTESSIRLLDEQAAALKKNLSIAEITDQRVNVLNRLGLERTLQDVAKGFQVSRQASGIANDQGQLLFIRVQHLYSQPRLLTPSEEDIYYSKFVERLRQFIGPSAVIARVGQYDFAVLQLGKTAVDNDLLHRRMSDPIEINRRRIPPDLRIGVFALLGQWGLEPSEMISNADLAMRQAVKVGSNPVVAFDSTMASLARYHEEIAASLPLAVERNEFEIVYQPIVTLSTGSADKVEALLRWSPSRLGSVSPEVFIPAAESQGLIGRITAMVAQGVLRDRSMLASKGVSVPDVSVNISGLTLQTPEALFEILEVFERFIGTEVNGVTVEITEGVLVSNSAQSQETFARLRKLGFKVSLDDFGVGYSSLAYLTNFDLDFLKIDKAFLSGFESDLPKQSVVKSIIEVAHALEIKVVAEGVETQEQAELLCQMGCDYGQGYFFSRPLAFDDLANYLPKIS